jgi:iron-sulfur cluster protein
MKKTLIREKINDSFLRKALKNFSATYPAARSAALQGTDFEALRERISNSKRKCLSELSQLIERFTNSAEESGATVHFCPTAADAKSAILRIIRDTGADFLIKSKSMTSEEIGLNHYLEKAGIRCLETDLGEWIIQLAGERPSHMVMPAIHKNKEAVADLFSRETGTECPPDIPFLVSKARETLRDGFLTAGVGLSGANLAIADSGTICIVTNEGNGRLVTTGPETHIALVGVDKIVPSLTEGLDVLNILPKNATGQKITSYVSFIKGPAGENRNLHIVLLDNGRLKLAADPDFSEALKCIKCGACANVCPIYEIVGGHVFGHIYVGGIGLVLTPFFHGFDKAEDILRLCIGCRRCNEVCAANINIEGLILDLRDKIRKPVGRKFLFSTMMKNRKLLHGALRTAYLAQKPFQSEDGRIRHLPLFLDISAGERSLPPIAEKPFRDLVLNEKKIADANDAKKEKILFFSGCLADFVFPQMCMDAMDSLEKLGYSVTFPHKQLCCGIPARYAGEIGVARDMARLNIDVLMEEKADYIVTVCPTCTVSLRHDFAKLLENEPEYRQKAADLGAKVFNYSELAVRKISPFAGKEVGATITYHDACHLKRGCGVYREPREALKHLGFDLREMIDSDKCCGFGGSYTFKFPEISTEILKNKIDVIKAAGAETVAVDCPGCKMQIEGGLDAGGNPIGVEHTATLVMRNLT